MVAAMRKTQPDATLSGMIETDIEDDTMNGDAFPTPESNSENVPSAKRKTGRTKASGKRFSKPKTGSRKPIGTSKTADTPTIPKKRAGRKKAQPKQQSSEPHGDETEEVDEFADQPEEQTMVDELNEPKKRGKKKRQVAKEKKESEKPAVKPVGAIEKDGEFEYTPTSTRTTRLGMAAAAESANIIPETQMPMNAEPEDMETEELPQSVFKRPDVGRAQKRPPSDDVSDAEHAGEPALRRKLGEMNKKYENLESRYRNLREIGIKEAEANFERLRVQTDARAEAAADLIASLKKELSLQKTLTADATSICTQIEGRDADLAKTRALADSLSTSLAEAQNENKTLQAKLAASRSMSTAVESLGSKTPGSATRARQQQTAGMKTLIMGSAEAAQAAQIAQLKEDLYSDLTGLILRGVDRMEETDVYDCLQTGRNGSM